MQKLTRIIFIPKNKKCVSLRRISYMFATENALVAEEKAWELLKQDTNHPDMYNCIAAFETARYV